MAHITEFTVEGLAGRTEPYSQKLNRDINVFCGQNGSGKTSLLKILHWAMREDAQPLWVVPFKRASVSVYSIDYKQVFTYTCEKPEVGILSSPEQEVPDLTQNLIISTTRPESPPQLQWSVNPPRNKKTKEGGWRHRYLPTSRLYLSPRPSYRGTIDEEELEQVFASVINQAWSAYSAVILGGIQRAQAKGLADILVGMLRSTSEIDQADGQSDPLKAYERVAKFLERQGLKSVLGDSQTFYQNYLVKPLLRGVVADIERVELQIQEELAPREKLQSLLEKMFTGNKSIRLTDATIEILGMAKRKIGLERLSSGEKHLILIFIDTILSAESALLLDEPEISMHVDWQKQLVQAMRQLNPNAQLILATHSPEITADISEEKIFDL